MVMGCPGNRRRLMTSASGCGFSSRSGRAAYPLTGDAATTRKMFVGNVHGGTLVYRKKLIDEGGRYPEINLAEDAGLVQYAARSGKRLVRLSNPGVFIYVRHGRNAWREFAPGRFMNPAGWKRIAQPRIFAPSVLASYEAAAASS